MVLLCCYSSNTSGDREGTINVNILIVITLVLLIAKISLLLCCVKFATNILWRHNLSGEAERDYWISWLAQGYGQWLYITTGDNITAHQPPSIYQVSTKQHPELHMFPLQPEHCCHILPNLLDWDSQTGSPRVCIRYERSHQHRY